MASWFKTSGANACKSAQSRYDTMAKKIPEQAQSTAEKIKGQVSDRVRPHNPGLADAIGVVDNDDEDTYGVGLPLGHPLMQTFSDLEYGSETTRPEPVMRQLGWDTSDLEDEFAKGIQP